MDCYEARSRFLELTLSHGNAEDSGQPDALCRHLDECGECRAEFDAECVEDLQLARTIQAVDLPNDLESRLLRSAAARQAVPAQIPPARRSRPLRRWTATAASLFGIAVCLSLAIWMSRPVRLTLAELELLVERANPAASTQPASPLERPSGWRQLARVAEQAESMVQTQSGQPQIGLVHFTFRPRESTSATAGRLWVVPASKLAGADLLPDLQAAEMQYRPQITHLVWQESGTVYLLELGDDIAGLRLLHEALLGMRTVA